ncbi:MAG: aminopeptidase P family protein [Alphaproteobacteria bacterium]|nr:aminopeptidase P family protein [Alphaproteobacteria bacterium]
MMLLNKPRAHDVMAKHGLDGLIATFPQNVYYLSGYWDTQFDSRWPFLNYAVLPQRDDAPATLILRTVTLDRLSLFPTWMPNLIAVSDYSGRQKSGGLNRETGEPAAVEWKGWPRRPGATLTPLERTWAAHADAHAGHLAATSAWGLRRALIEAGIEAGKVGCDDPRVLGWLHEMGLDRIEIVDALNIFREIRMVKSPAEIAVMRRAAVVNEEALEASIAAAHEGATWRELETVYHVEHARRGGRGGHILTALGGLPNERVVKGEPFLFDALGEYEHYFGDLGRTAVVGEPSAELVRRMRAIQAGWRAACEAIRPGLRRSALIDRVVKAVQQAGFPEYFYVSPHSIGLEHTDSPVLVGPRTHDVETADYALEANMVINVDMPYYELGWGNIHVEDTVVVTSDGYEPLTSERMELRVLPERRS